jgi:hypothetical protein
MLPSQLLVTTVGDNCWYTAQRHSPTWSCSSSFGFHISSRFGLSTLQAARFPGAAHLAGTPTNANALTPSNTAPAGHASEHQHQTACLPLLNPPPPSLANTCRTTHAHGPVWINAQYVNEVWVPDPVKPILQPAAGSSGGCASRQFAMQIDRDTAGEGEREGGRVLSSLGLCAEKDSAARPLANPVPLPLSPIKVHPGQHMPSSPQSHRFPSVPARLWPHMAPGHGRLQLVNYAGLVQSHLGAAVLVGLRHGATPWGTKCIQSGRDNRGESMGAVNAKSKQ